MEFVNSIAKIVHMEVSLHGGSPNKNIGDAFLLVWKLPKGYTSCDIPRASEMVPRPTPALGYHPKPPADKSPGVSIAVHAFGEASRSAPPERSYSGGYNAGSTGGEGC